MSHKGLKLVLGWVLITSPLALAEPSATDPNIDIRTNGLTAGFLNITSTGLVTAPILDPLEVDPGVIVALPRLRTQFRQSEHSQFSSLGYRYHRVKVGQDRSSEVLFDANLDMGANRTAEEFSAGLRIKGRAAIGSGGNYLKVGPTGSQGNALYHGLHVTGAVEGELNSHGVDEFKEGKIGPLLEVGYRLGDAKAEWDFIAAAVLGAYAGDLGDGSGSVGGRYGVRAQGTFKDKFVIGASMGQSNALNQKGSSSFSEKKLEGEYHHGNYFFGVSGSDKSADSSTSDNTERTLLITAGGAL